MIENGAIVMNYVTDEMLQTYCDALRTDYYKWREKCNTKNPSSYDPGMKFIWERGNKFIKIVHTETNGSHRSVHSFVVGVPTTKWKTGDILKAASWRAPAQNFSRGHITGTLNKFSWAGL